MKNHDEHAIINNFPKLHLNEEAKDRIHSRILHHTPPAPQKKPWKEGKFIGLITAVMGLVLFSVLTVYILSETEKEKADQLLADAEEKVGSIYLQMEEHLEAAGSKALLKGVDHEGLKSAEVSMDEVNGDPSLIEDEKVKKLNEKLIALQEYNQLVPFANKLQQEITVVNKELHESTSLEGMQEKIGGLKNELDAATKRFDRLESKKLKTFFQGRYSPQAATIEETFNQLQNMKSEIEELSTIAKEQSLNEDDFKKEIEGMLQQLGNLPSKQTAMEMEKQIREVQIEYNNTQQVKEEEKQRQEEIRLDNIRKEEERKSAEAKKAADAQKEQDDELYPMEFTETTSEGIVIKYSRDLKGNETYLHYDEIAKKYGGRYYYTPSSDMAYIFKNKKIIATISMVSTAPLEYKELFIDINTYKGSHTKDEFTTIVNSVIQTGKSYKVEKGQGGEGLWLENGVLLYHVW
jgi:hypothetical protein